MNPNKQKKEKCSFNGLEWKIEQLLQAAHDHSTAKDWNRFRLIQAWTSLNPTQHDPQPNLPGKQRRTSGDPALNPGPSAESKAEREQGKVMREFKDSGCFLKMI